MVCTKATLVNVSSTDDQLVAVKMARSKLIQDLCTVCVHWLKLRTSHTDISSKLELHSLLKESLLMKQFDHRNIVGLLGVCFDTPDGYPYLIIPFMVNGNIQDYLKDKRVHPTNSAVLPIVCYCAYIMHDNNRANESNTGL